MKYSLMFLIFTASYLNAINFKEGNKEFPYQIWFGGGIGALGTADGRLININASLNYSKNDRIFKFRGILARELVILGPRPDDEVWELGLLYGGHSTKGKVSVSYLAGISYTGGSYKGDRLDSGYYEELTFGTFGLPLEIQFNAKLLEYVGFSIILFADINPDKSYGGVNFAILLGQLPGLTGTTHFKRLKFSLY
ncbi:MAG: hypothetical protein RBS89_08240 [Candidatus Delongbacteria bacterium]|jgi:hypothetical protein|nr:hypothetical protein [Candidatus Delongbacteria bacterium]